MTTPPSPEPIEPSPGTPGQATPAKGAGGAGNDRLQAALAYAALGWHVIPVHGVSEGRCTCGDGRCESPGKHPRIDDWPAKATTDPATIRGWWRRWPDANVAVVLDRSGLVAIDIDPRTGGDQRWRSLAAAHPPPRTPTALTGGGGWHLIFRFPPDHPSPRGGLGRGVDVKHRGYVVLPPSRHIMGWYRWETHLSPLPPDRVPPSPVPEWLAVHLNGPGTPTGAPLQPIQSVNGTVTDLDLDLDPTTAPVPLLWDRPWHRGTRHNALIRLVGWLRGQGVPRDLAERLLRTWNETRCVPPLTEDEFLDDLEDCYRRWPPPAVPLLEDGATPAKAGGQAAGIGTGTGAGDEPEPGRRRYEIVDAVEFVRRPPPRWQVAGIVARGTFASLYGLSGTGKSFLAIELSCCVATGTPFYGRPVVAGTVLYVCAEGAAAFGKRLLAWQRQRGVTLARDRLWVLPGTVPLTDPASVPLLIDQLTAMPVRPDLVVLDTLSRNLAGGDENAPEVMTAAIARALLLQRAFGCTVLVVHHGRRVDGAMRGHSSLIGALDTILHVEHDDEQEITTVTCEKQKDHEAFSPIRLRRVRVDVAEDLPPPTDDENEDDVLIPVDTTSLVLNPLSPEEDARLALWQQGTALTATQRIALAILADATDTGEGLTVADLIARWPVQHAPAHRRNYYRAIQALLAKRLAVADAPRGDLRYNRTARYRLTPAGRALATILAGEGQGHRPHPHPEDDHAH